VVDGCGIYLENYDSVDFYSIIKYNTHSKGLLLRRGDRMDVFKEKGEFKVVLGKGHLSLYEINSLKEEDVVTVSHRAGNPYPVYFNDNPIVPRRDRRYR